MPAKSTSPFNYPELNLSLFLERLESFSCLEKRILLAVSGGVDSIVMAELFHQAGVKIGIAHLNHGLRGNQADEDEEFVEGWAKKRELPYFGRKLDLVRISDDKNMNLMEAARDERYAFFDQIMQAEEFECLATAHHKDDNIETVIFQARRGIGLRGLRGIPEQRDHIIRPLLHFERTQIEAFAKRNQIDWREDPSNANQKYSRNEIRHSLIPSLEKFHPGIKNVIHQKSKEIEREFELVLPLIQEWFDAHIQQEESGFSILKSDLESLPHFDFVIAEMMRPYGITSGRIEELLRLMKSSNSAVLLTNNFEFINDRERLIVQEIKEQTNTEYQISSPEDFKHLPFKLDATQTPLKDVSFNDDRSTVFLDFEKLSWPLVVRHPKTGDRIQPLGMKGSMLLSDFFTQQKLSLPEKRAVWILCSGNDIVWIINHRIHHRFRISQSTATALRLEVKM